MAVAEDAARLLTIPEVAERLSMSRRSVYRLIDTGKLGALYVRAEGGGGGGGMRRVPLTELLAFVERLMAEAEDEAQELGA